MMGIWENLVEMILATLYYHVAIRVFLVVRRVSLSPMIRVNIAEKVAPSS